MTRSTFLTIILSLFLINACGEESTTPVNEEQQKQRVINDLEQVALQINNLVGDASADQLQQCEMLPIGAKPCGGPWGYLIFSTADLDANTLETLVETYTELDHERNLLLGLASDCAYVGPPEIEFTDNKCRGIGRSAWNPGELLKINNIDDD